MNYSQANLLKNDFQYLIGKTIDNSTISDIVIAPTAVKDFQTFLDHYLRYEDADLALAPFSQGDLTVEVIYEQEQYISNGYFIYGTIFHAAKKLDIEIDLQKYGIK